MDRLYVVLLAAIMLPVVIFLIILCSLAIAIFDGRPIFFKSERLGKDKKNFSIFKLRTMSVCAPIIPSSAENASGYVTRIGRFLRFTSLDEMPQIFNILSGDMAFIGPRPCLSSEFRLIELRDAEGIFSMKPGVTGLAQVRGRDRVSVKNKVRYELFYCKKKSLLFDIRIIFMTIKVVFKFSSISH